MTQALDWHDQAELLGVRIRAFFFDPQAVNARADFVGRQLPNLPDMPNLPNLPNLPTPVTRLLAPEGQRASYRVPGLLAQPDAVLAHGNGLLCLTYKGGDGRLHAPDTWQRQWRVDVMLQCLATGMAVAGQCQQVTAVLWRGANLLCQFDPSPTVLECLASQIGAARHYWREPQQVSPAQLASFCEPKLRAMPGLLMPEDVGASPALPA